MGVGFTKSVLDELATPQPPPLEVKVKFTVPVKLAGGE